MNPARRKQIRALETRIETELKTSAAALVALLEELVGKYQDIKDEEQEAFDNLPESLQNGEKGGEMLEAIGHLDEIDAMLNDHKDNAESLVADLENLISSSDAAKGME